jgi:hypothetical protein
MPIGDLCSKIFTDGRCGQIATVELRGKFYCRDCGRIEAAVVMFGNVANHATRPRRIES